MKIKIKQLFKHPIETILNKSFTLSGWIKTTRKQKNFSFISLNDGSSFSSMQIVLNDSVNDFETISSLPTGTAIEVSGKITKSPGKEQSIELIADEAKIIGFCDPESYPLQKKRHSFEFLRTIAHLRPRTNTQGAITRLRSHLAFATHQFFQERDFFYIQTPILTSSDCEGGGAMFRVTTLDPMDKKNEDINNDFFHKKAFLTVSGQLNAEALALALGNVYTFGPTFRAENSNTSRHLAEFWMIEPEMAFADLKDNIDIAEAYIKAMVTSALKNCPEEMKFFDEFIEKGLIHRLEHVRDSNFERVSYTQAVDILSKASKSFVFPVHFGVDLQSEHERYLTEEFFKKPVVVTDYPASIKAFYMRANEDQKTVAAMDILVPKIGEIVGGSQREERENVLREKIKKMGLNEEDYSWYLELRKFGSAPHAGFGVGFERLLLFISGMENIRDVIPFPRFPGHIDY